MALKYNLDWHKEITDMPPGSTIRLNHEDCTAGADAKRRLYITKPPTGDRILAYCHNCQEGSSFLSNDGYRVSFGTDKAPRVVEPKDGTFQVPPGLVECQSDWPNEMLRHVAKYGMAGNISKQAGLAYEPHTHSIYIPMYDEVIFNPKFNVDSISMALKGYQLRSLRGHGPKYTTCMKDGGLQMSSLLTLAAPQTTPRIGVVVEDYLSGVRIINAFRMLKPDATVSVLVNYGTKVDPQVLTCLSDCNARLVVWLDNDNAHVIEQAKTMQKTLQLMHKTPCYRVEIEMDPKAAEYEGIGDILWT